MAPDNNIVLRAYLSHVNLGPWAFIENDARKCTANGKTSKSVLFSYDRADMLNYAIGPLPAINTS